MPASARPQNNQNPMSAPAAPRSIEGRRSIDWRIAVISPLPPPYGGMSVQAEKLIEGLRSEGIGVAVLRTNRDFPAGLRALSRVPGARTAVNFLLLVDALWRTLPACHVVHHLSCSHWYFFLVTAPTVLIGHLLRKPVIINYRGGEAERFLSRWAWLARPLLRAGRVVVPSEFLRMVFARFGIESVIVPNIADLKRFAYQPRPRLRPRCISTRQLEDLYNVECTLEAFRRVQQIYPEAELAIAGDGRARPALERYVQQHGLRQVKFYGAVDHDTLAGLYQQSDIFVNASRADNFPGALIEAAACGLPIVSTNVGGIPYLVEDGRTACLVGPSDPAALAEKILFLLSHPEEAMQMAARAEAVCRQYDWCSVYQQWRAVYERAHNEMEGGTGAGS